MIKKEIEEDLLREVASVGGHYGKKLEESLRKVKRIKRALSYLEERLKRHRSVPPTWSVKRSVSLRKSLREAVKEAKKFRQYLVIYREAIGLTNHRILHEVYELELLKDEGGA